MADKRKSRAADDINPVQHDPGQGPSLGADMKRLPEVRLSGHEMADIIDGLRNAAGFSKQLSERAAENNLDADEIAKYRGQHLPASSLLEKMVAYRPRDAGANQVHTVQVTAQDIAMTKRLLLQLARSLHFGSEDEDEPVRSQQREEAGRMLATRDRLKAHWLPRAARATPAT